MDIFLVRGGFRESKAGHFISREGRPTGAAHRGCDCYPDRWNHGPAPVERINGPITPQASCRHRAALSVPYGRSFAVHRDEATMRRARLGRPPDLEPVRPLPAPLRNLSILSPQLQVWAGGRLSGLLLGSIIIRRREIKSAGDVTVWPKL